MMSICFNCREEVDSKDSVCGHCGVELYPTRVMNRKDPEVNWIRQDDFSGRTIGERFDVLEKIAEGGMGVVYKARDLVLDETVALKILRADRAQDEETIQRFKREIKVTRKIRHPNVSQVFDVGRIGDLLFISMEFLAGQDLDIYMETERPSETQLSVIIKGILQGLQAAHGQNIIHRDLKPANIKILPDGRPVIMDFGIARFGGRTDLTSVDAILGTPLYMAPEQFRAKEIDCRCDIYSFGVILYRLYTGTTPFTGMSPIELAVKHMQDQPVPPRKINAEITKQREAVILKCLEKEPRNRYQTVQELLDDLGVRPIEQIQPELNPASTILIAEDDPDILKLMNFSFQHAGYRVIGVSNGREAISEALSAKPDVICLDVVMPVMDGYDAAAYLRSDPHTSGIPLIMITSRSDRENQAFSKSVGVSHFFRKPVDLDKLLTTIGTLVSRG
jgi:serine/threonine protein kinase